MRTSVLLLIAAFVPVASIRAEEVAEIVEKAKQAIVLLSWDEPGENAVLSPSTFQEYQITGRGEDKTGAPKKVYANGVVVTADGLIIAIGPPTLSANASNIWVTLENKQKLEARRMVVDERSGLCLLKVSNDKDLPFMKLEVGEPRVGDSLVNVHRAADLAEIASVGILAAKDRTVAGKRGLLQTDLSVNPGSSGSPVLTQDGRLAGLVWAARFADAQSAGSTGFAISAAEVPTLMKYLNPNQSVLIKPAYLGVSLADTDGEVAVRSVLPESGAAKAGIKVNDLILEIAGQAVSTSEEVKKNVAQSEPGQEIAVKIQRGEQVYVLPTVLGKRPPLVGTASAEVSRVVPGVSIPLTALEQAMKEQVPPKDLARSLFLQQIIAQQEKQRSVTPATKSLQVQRSGLDQKVEDLSKEVKQLREQIEGLTKMLKRFEANK